MLYDLPDRDCHANASQGELHAASGGLETYKRVFVDGIAAAFAAHPDQRIVAIIEPDSLPNLATNPGIDAWYWVKPPGESDGTSDPTAPDYDPDCGKEDAATSAPPAGEWFHAYALDLVRNARPPLVARPGTPGR